eukprot:Selendium_serpulae@DN3027_c0_g1_i1.p1
MAIMALAYFAIYLTGAIVVIRFLVGFILRMFAPAIDLKSTGTYAVVTGGTDGIGKAMAIELARKGMSIVIVGRNAEKLENTKSEIKQVCKGVPEVKTIQADFAAKDQDALWTNLEAELKNIDVGVLINNVGMSYPGAQYFHELSKDFINEIIHLNVTSILKMTNIVYPTMVKKEKGVICCVGSGSSVIPSDPLYSAYAATKSVADAFCRSLAVEASAYKISVQCHVPLMVETKLSKARRGATVPTPEAYAEQAIVQLSSMQQDCATISPMPVHHIMLMVVNAFPRPMWHVWRFYQTKVLREKFHKKKAQQAQQSATIVK